MKYKLSKDGIEYDDFVIIVHGNSLAVIFGDESLEKDFAELCDHAKTACCCRVSPSQKAQFLKMIKQIHPDEGCLAIGDGSNDVPMI